MKKVIIVAFFLSFFSCSEKKSSNTSNNSGNPIPIVFVFSGDEYEFTFYEASDLTTLIDSGFVYGRCLPIGFVENPILVPDIFIRFYDDFGYSLIMTQEFLNQQIQECSLNLYANDPDEFSYDIVYNNNENFGLRFRVYRDDSVESDCYFQDHVWYLEGEDIMKFDWDEIKKEIEKELKENESPQFYIW